MVGDWYPCLTHSWQLWEWIDLNPLPSESRPEIPRQNCLNFRSASIACDVALTLPLNSIDPMFWTSTNSIEPKHIVTRGQDRLSAVSVPCYRISNWCGLSPYAGRQLSQSAEVACSPRTANVRAPFPLVLARHFLDQDRLAIGYCCNQVLLARLVKKL